MNIGLIIYGSLDTLSGGYLYDRRLVEHLRTQGHRVTVHSLPWRNYAAHLTDNVRRGWLRTVAAEGYDVLLQDELNHPSLAWLNDTWHMHTSAPIVAIVHHLRSSEHHPRALLPLYRRIEARYLRSVNGFIYNSRTTQATVRRHLSHARPGVVAYPAADHLRIPQHDEVVADLANKATSPKPMQLLFVGNLIPRKALHHVLEALAGVCATTWQLHVVGDDQVDPGYSSQVHQLVQSLFPPAQVTWHGRVDDATLQQLYRDSDLLVVPSYEGFGIVYLEAMAFGLPVVAARAGAAHEIVTPGVNGALVPLDSPDAVRDALLAYLRNRINLAAQGYAARQRFEAHPTWQQSMQQAESFLHEIRNQYR